MALPVREQVTYWGIAAAVFLVVLWYLGDVILPFVLGGAIAYLLDPLADRLERVGLSRAAATAIITVAAVLIFVLVALLVIPTLVRQTTELIQTAPVLVAQLRDFVVARFPDLVVPDSQLRQTFDQIGATIQSRGAELLNTVVASVGSLLNVVLLFVVVPVVAVYLLLDWDRMIAEIDTLLPRDHAPVIRRLAREIDASMSGFLRGMGTVCLILGTYYAVALMLVGLNFGLVVGFVAGILTFIPYVGAIVGGVLAIGLALFQFWGDWLWIVAVAAIFQVGQLVEGNVLTPRLVGSSVGLHPVWLLFALSVFGSLFGFVGMLVAVPVAAALGVLARFVVQQYRGSRLYRGLEATGEDE
ncbi:AI-2E family transporter [Rhodosalinus halophilus]|uniref:AI-2E family transporter n=1 Tax=Rhodosalinus halophilus TaxID=2259333 RepID=A0A365U6A8_9RHOB|nr:AI-2E family transporter [Rhodosalinus halophilus]RBI84047.1 AI-2E family transporter [Rhodosalinus halophilus]